MARTIRRRGCGYDYRWVLLDDELSCWRSGSRVRHDYHSPAGRKALARYHSDAIVTMGQSAPHWYRKTHDRRIRMHNREVMQRWLRHPDFDPVFIDWHRHDANWSWW